MAKKTDQYRYVKIKNSNKIKKASEETGLYLSESIRKSQLFNRNKTEQLAHIEKSKKLIGSISEKLKKLDSYLHYKNV